MNIVEVVGAVEYDLIGGFFSIISILFTFLFNLAPIVLLLFISRIVWLIYKLEKRKFDEKNNP